MDMSFLKNLENPPVYVLNVMFILSMVLLIFFSLAVNTSNGITVPKILMSDCLSSKFLAKLFLVSS